MDWVYIAVPVTPALLEVTERLWRTPSLAAEALQMGLIAAMMEACDESEWGRHMHGLLEEAAGELHQLWESGEISMVTVREERIRT